MQKTRLIKNIYAGFIAIMLITSLYLIISDINSITYINKNHNIKMKLSLKTSNNKIFISVSLTNNITLFYHTYPTKEFNKYWIINLNSDIYIDYDFNIKISITEKKLVKIILFIILIIILYPLSLSFCFDND